MPITEPESPALALKRRRLNGSHQSEQEQEEKEEIDGRVIRANPMPDMAKAFQPKLPHKKVETQPFSFEERDKNKPNRETFVEMILRKEKVNLSYYFSAIVQSNVLIKGCPYFKENFVYRHNISI